MARLKTLRPRLSETKGRVKTINSDSWRATKTTAAQRGYGYRWQQARERFLNAHPLCCYCERQGLVTAATVVDHIVAHQGDQELFWDQTNWQPLCKTCHDSVKKAEEAGRKA
ncbi:HNH endonuclease [Pseudomonas otitidis]|uniref:Putative HNH nuclease YajD n=1 Tax=Metapseudomonas otitidis TaxID=319939 RepID=A0A7X3HB43_9GAMM|nr:HNH endonuclease signature motif containing protein [Pseudomonas otitidis]MWK58721.1 HNH endonuclease [Pseudomonas otitidis]